MPPLAKLTSLSARNPHPRRPGVSTPARPRQGSVIVLVLVTLVFAAVALTAFLEKASNDLLVEAREATAARLRLEAYSALETTLAVLEDFRLVGGGLRSPREGWADPLGFVGYEAGEGRTVTVAFEDESGKLSLPNADALILVNLFKAWGFSELDAELITDALLGWIHKEHVPSTSGAPRADDYERGEIPFVPPGRSLRSFEELAAIDVARDFFYDEAGRPNEWWHRFVSSVSLYRYRRTNLNAAPPDVLAAIGNYDVTQQRALAEYLEGGVGYRQTPGYFKSLEEAAPLLGPQAQTEGFGTEIHALRIRLTVQEGRLRYELNTVVAPSGGARVVPPAELPTASQPAPAAPTPAPATGGTSRSGAPAEEKNLGYPFTLLEIQENDATSSRDEAGPSSSRL